MTCKTSHLKHEAIEKIVKSIDQAIKLLERAAIDCFEYGQGQTLSRIGFEYIHLQKCQKLLVGDEIILNVSCLEQSKNLSLTRKLEKKRLTSRILLDDSTNIPVCSIESVLDTIPASWTVLSVSYDKDTESLFLLKLYQNKQTSISLPLNRHEDLSFTLKDAKARFESILEQSKASTRDIPSITSKKDKRNWWTLREKLDNKLGALLEDIENHWFSGFKGFLVNTSSNNHLSKHLIDIIVKMVSMKDKDKVTEFHIPESILEMLFCQSHTGSTWTQDISHFILDFYKLNGFNAIYDEELYDWVYS